MLIPGRMEGPGRRTDEVAAGGGARDAGSERPRWLVPWCHGIQLLSFATDKVILHRLLSLRFPVCKPLGRARFRLDLGFEELGGICPPPSLGGC